MNWPEQQVLVTGACGFIGSHLVEQLVQRGASVKALTLYDARGSNGWMDHIDPELKLEVEIVQGDVRDAELIRSLVQPDDVVFHLAALIGIPYSYQSPSSYVDTNIRGTLNILDAARGAEARRVINMSTSEVYGSALRIPIDEDHPLQGQSPYSASKIGAEKLAESYFLSFSLPVVNVRAFNTYGPRQPARAVIPTILMQLVNRDKELRLGNPATTQDFNYVSDTAEGLIRLAECDAAVGQSVNIGTGIDHSIRCVAEIARSMMDHTNPVYPDPHHIRPAGSEVQRLCADNALLKKLTGWAPTVPLEEGLRHTAEWLQKESHRHEPKHYYV